MIGAVIAVPFTYSSYTSAQMEKKIDNTQKKYEKKVKKQQEEIKALKKVNKDQEVKIETNTQGVSDTNKKIDETEVSLRRQIKQVEEEIEQEKKAKEEQQKKQEKVKKEVEVVKQEPKVEAKSVVKKEETKQITNNNIEKEADSSLKTFDAEVTFYTANAESTGKSVGDTGYGITASGAQVRSGMVAMDNSIYPFGTKVRINGTVYTNCDTGGAISGNRIDIYVPTVSQAQQLGRQTVKAEIVEWGNGKCVAN
ncbi:3D domain-containing protein [Priestia endophytica]